MGQPFEGIAVTGYDNLREEYESIWIDNMGTGIMKSTGSYDAKKKTIHLSGNFSCPMTQEKNRWNRSEWKRNNKNKYTYTSYQKGPDGKEFKAMQITYRREK